MRGRKPFILDLEFSHTECGAGNCFIDQKFLGLQSEMYVWSTEYRPEYTKSTCHVQELEIVAAGFPGNLATLSRRSRSWRTPTQLKGEPQSKTIKFELEKGDSCKRARISWNPRSPWTLHQFEEQRIYSLVERPLTWEPEAPHGPGGTMFLVPQVRSGGKSGLPSRGSGICRQAARHPM